MQNLEEAHVSTIHGFCADLLRERPVEARRRSAVPRADRRRRPSGCSTRRSTRWFQAQLEDPPEGVRRSLRRASRGVPARRGRRGRPDGAAAPRRLRADAVARLPRRRGRASRSIARRAIARADRAACTRSRDLSATPSYAGDNLFVDTAPVRRLSRDLRAPRPLGDRDDLDGLEAQLIELRRNRDFKRARKGSGPTYARA